MITLTNKIIPIIMIIMIIFIIINNLVILIVVVVISSFVRPELAILITWKLKRRNKSSPYVQEDIKTCIFYFQLSSVVKSML